METLVEITEDKTENETPNIATLNKNTIKKQSSISSFFR